MFLWDTITPAGVRVDPEVYCSSAILEYALQSGGEIGGESRSSASISITVAHRPLCALNTLDYLADDTGRCQCHYG